MVTKYVEENMMNNYLKAITQFSFDEVKNAELQIDCWSAFTELTDNYS